MKGAGLTALQVGGSLLRAGGLQTEAATITRAQGTGPGAAHLPALRFFFAERQVVGGCANGQPEGAAAKGSPKGESAVVYR